MRTALFSLGVSQISAGSSVSVGGYSSSSGELSRQFEISDSRTLDETVRSICSEGYIPSFCTACYRSGRTGEKFMVLAKTGKIHNYCDPNALLTFMEYLIDYASPQTRAGGEIVIRKSMESLKTGARKEIEKRLVLIESGERDLYY
jgi:2-iminoacetate synthase